MAKRSDVPKFGNWDNEDIPYTMYFGKATKDKSGKMNSNISPDKQVLKSKHERRRSREEATARKLTESPLHYGVSGQRDAVEVVHPSRHDGVKSLMSKQDQHSGSNENDMKKTVDSPLHHRGIYHQARTGEKGSGVSSPSWEKKGLSQGSSHGLAPSTPQRSRLRPGNETPDRATVPRFGDWDESDPASAENYSQIFNKVREEKQIGKGSRSETYSSSQLPCDNDHDFKVCVYEMANNQSQEGAAAVIHGQDGSTAMPVTTKSSVVGALCH